MGLDINLIREEKGGDPNIVKDSQKKRFKPVEFVEEIITLDQQWRKFRYSVDMLNKEYSLANKEVAKKKKESKGSDPCLEEIAKVQEIDRKIKEAEILEADNLDQLTRKYNTIGNLVHESVPISNNEDDNKVERTWGTIKEQTINSTPGNCHHHEIMAMIDGYDMKRGSKIAGHRGYFLKGPGVLLNQALQQYGTQFLMKRGYTPIQTPYFMKRSIMGETAQLSDFDDQLYKVTTGSKDPNDEYYLIATSEQPISAMYRKEWLEPKDLPIKYSGLSTCFRKEAGASGKDVWGIFRIHQFEKIEQFIFCAPEDSWKLHEDMILASEEFIQSLELPYRVVNIVSGALNDAAAKKYDLEAWFPGYGAYRELVSCSNCTDYQSRSLEIRFGSKQADSNSKKYVHMLNGTLCATQRTLCCILENYQTDKGLMVPKVLQPFCGTDFFPYTKSIPSKEDLGGPEEKVVKPTTKKPDVVPAQQSKPVPQKQDEEKKE